MTKYWNSMISVLKELISYNTVRGEELDNAPFGKINKECLTRTLEIGRELGFTTKDVDGYAGHIEWQGTGEGLVGILGHLDIVPAGDGWDYDPFGCQEVDGYMYGRGVLDDKGPVVSCLFAMKKLMDEGFKPTKTIRLIMGCNEENGSTCVEHYFTKEAMPDVAFSPDGDFPLIHCEKGIVWVKTAVKNTLKSFSNIKGGDKTNMVPAKATCSYNGDLTEDFFTSRGIEAKKSGCCSTLILTATGRSAHGSTPNKGENAISKLLKVILEVEPNEEIKYLYESFGKDTDGNNAGLKCSDEKSGELTLNFGTINEENGNLAVSLDIRYPITITLESIFDILKKNATVNAEFSTINAQAGLFVDPDSHIVKTLMGIYQKHTGSNSPSLAIGGGTYARELKCGVAFGPMFEDEETTIHMPNERLKLSNFEKMFDIYGDAIKALAE